MLFRSVEVRGGNVTWHQLRQVIQRKPATLTSFSLIGVSFGRCLLAPLLRHGSMENLDFSFSRGLDAELQAVLSWGVEADPASRKRQALTVLDLTGTDLQLPTLRKLLAIMTHLKKLYIGLTPAAALLEENFDFLEVEDEFGVELIT